MRLLTATFLSGSIAALMSSACFAIELSLEDALHLSTSTGDIKGVKVQLEAGADPNAKNEDGDTALHAASKASGYVDIALALLKAGADPNVTDKRGQTPLFHATLNALVLCHGYSAMYQDRPKFEEHLMRADLVRDPENAKPHLKPEEWNDEVRKALGPGKADLNAMTMLKALLDAGARPDFKDRQGFTPLDVARAHGKIERLAKIMGIDPQYLAGSEGSTYVMHGGATYWVRVHGGYRSREPLELLIKQSKTQRDASAPTAKQKQAANGAE